MTDQTTRKPTAGDVALYTLTFLLALLLGLIFAYRTYLYHRSAAGIDFGHLTDWDSFHITALLVWSGDVAKAYYAEFLRPFQAQFGTQFLSWAYPPPFNLLLAPFGLMRLDVGYVVFVAATAAFYFAILWRVAGAHFRFCFVVTFPALMYNVTGGQNGFLTGGLIGLACLWLLRNESRAGFPLGLLVIKPHLGIAFALEALLHRRWMVIGAGVLVTAALLLVSTLAFGLGIWPAFVNGAREAAERLATGAFVLEIMTSTYALLRSTGVSPALSMGLHLVVAALYLGMVLVAIHYRWPQRRVLGIVALVTPFLSPYAFIYDMPVLGIAIGLLAPDLFRLMNRLEITGFGLSVFLTGFIGYYERWNQVGFSLGSPDLARPTAIAFGGLFSLLTVLIAWHALRRDARLRAAAATAAPETVIPPLPASRSRPSLTEAAGRPDPARKPEAHPAPAPRRSAP